MSGRDNRSTNGKQLTRRRKQKRKLILFAAEVIVLLLLLTALYVWGIVGKVDIQDFEDTEAGINEDLSTEALTKLGGYTNIALFGLDNRSSNSYQTGNSDTIMIASINNDTKDIKIVSVYRDTHLSIGNGKFGKANSAYAKGGVKQAVQMLNANLDLDITEYVCVDWAALIEAIDALGGVEIELTEAEIKHLNKYVRDMNKEIGSEKEKVSEAGIQTLNGAQATAYARIRYTAGDDFKRSSRQRIVLEAMLNKAKAADIGTLLDICNAVFDDISTSLTLPEILNLAKDVKGYNIASTSGFPFEMTTKSLPTDSSAVVPIGLNHNVSQLHEYLFGTEDYEPSETVQMISRRIISGTGVTEEEDAINVDGFNDTAGQTGTDFKVEETETETETGTQEDDTETEEE
uniref:LCP family protein n=1 Tax=Agathobacter sp. TaxID=2021311 RepID=UPI0040561BC8